RGRLDQYMAKMAAQGLQERPDSGGRRRIVRPDPYAQQVKPRFGAVQDRGKKELAIEVIPRILLRGTGETDEDDGGTGFGAKGLSQTFAEGAAGAVATKKSEADDLPGKPGGLAIRQIASP